MNVFTRLKLVIAFVLCLFTSSAFGQDGIVKPEDKQLASDLEMLQGSWELMHGNTRSVKTIVGNKETLRRYDPKTGELRHEHSVTFELSKSGAVRVFTFLFHPDRPSMSFVYKVDEENFYDIPGLLHGERFQNYQERPKVWRWKRLADRAEKASTSSK